AAPRSTGAGYSPGRASGTTTASCTDRPGSSPEWRWQPKDFRSRSRGSGRRIERRRQLPRPIVDRLCRSDGTRRDELNPRQLGLLPILFISGALVVLVSFFYPETVLPKGLTYALPAPFSYSYSY